MKTLKWFTAVLIVCLLGIVSTGWCWGDPTPLPHPEGIITKIEANKVTLRNDAGKETTLEFKDTRGFKIGERVKIQEGRLMRVGTPPTKPGDSKALTPIQIPNVLEGGKLPRGPGEKGDLPGSLPHPEGIITKVEANKVTLRNDAGKETTLEVKDVRGFKVGDRVKIEGGKPIRVGTAPAKEPESKRKK